MTFRPATIETGYTLQAEDAAPPPTLDALEGQIVTTVVSIAAYGCQGTDDAADAYRTYIFARHLDSGALTQLEEDLNLLWPTFDGRFPDPDQLERWGFVVPPSPSRPVWDASYPASRAEFLTQDQEWRAVSGAYYDTIANLASQWRNAYLENQGALYTDTYFCDTRMLVHDYGCRCAHRSASSGSGPATLNIRSGVLYATPLDDTIDEALARAATLASKTERDVTQQNDSIVAALNSDDVRLALPETDPSLHYPEWAEARRNSLATLQDQLKVAFAANDHVALSALSPRLARQLRDPAAQAANASYHELTRSRITVFSDEDALDLLATLSPS